MMMHKTLVYPVFCLLVLAFGDTVLGHEGVTGIVKERMDAFKKSQGDLKALHGAARQNDFAVVASKAEELAAWASVMTDYFPEGSGGKPSEASPEIWSDPEGFNARAASFLIASEQMIAAASSQDSEAVGSGLTALAKTCKSCHQQFRLQ